MSTSKKIRLATENDGVSLLKIYGNFIKKTAITFEVEVPSALEFSKRIKNVLEKLPWLVCEINGENVGYAYASKHTAAKQQVSEVNAVGFQGRLSSKSLQKNKLFEDNHIENVLHINGQLMLLYI